MPPHDTTRLKRLAADQRADELNALFELSNRFRSHFELDGLLSEIIALSCELLDAEAASIALAEPKTGRLYFHVVHGGSGEAIKRIPLESGQGVVGWVVARGQLANIPDTSRDGRFSDRVDRETGYRTRSILGIPMSIGERTIGCLEVINKKGEGAVFDPDDETLGQILTSQAALAVEHVRMQQELVREQRLSTIGAMASTIIHDLRNPMTAIKGYAYLLGEQDPRNKEFVQVIEAESERITGMLREILEFSRGSTSLQVVDADVGAMMDEFFRTLERDLAESPELVVERRVDYRGALPMDTERMRRVLFNLVNNARDAMENRGRLLVGVARDGNDVVFRVEDTGKGMDEDTLGRLFEPFFTRGKKGGFGLGMAIVKNIVQGHGGRVEVESTPGVGTTIRVRLPVGR
ncbi:MAG: GAF domain-containing protein [Planctomycetes bacterium]|nr:GAF domain-containing protein [Planctomycetota bacterium]